MFTKSTKLTKVFSHALPNFKAIAALKLKFVRYKNNSIYRINLPKHWRKAISTLVNQHTGNDTGTNAGHDTAITGITGITGIICKPSTRFYKTRHVALDYGTACSNLTVVVRTEFTLDHRICLQRNQSENRDKNVLRH